MRDLQYHFVTKALYIFYLLLRVKRMIKNEDSVLLQEALEPHYIHEVSGERLTTRPTTIRNRHSVDTLAPLWLHFQDQYIIRGTAALSFNLFLVKENKNMLCSIDL